MTGLVGLAVVLAAFIILIFSIMGDSDKPKTTRHRLYLFLILFSYFFFRIWIQSTYHPCTWPALLAFLGAAIAAFAASFKDPVEVEDQKK